MSFAVERRILGRVRQYLVEFLAQLPKGTRLAEQTFATRHNLLIWVALAHVPILSFIAIRMGQPFGHVAGESGVIVLIVASSVLVKSRTMKSAIISLALVSCSALLVHYTNGLIESHFHFFVMLPLISMYRDWRPLVTGLGFVVLHHSIVGVWDPASVYNHPAALAHPIRWALIHGAFVLADTAVILAYWRFSEDLEYALAQEENRRLLAEEEAFRLESERLTQLVRSKDQFIASVSHELRTPLAAVLGFAEVLRDEPGISLTDRQELTSTIAAQAYELSGIVEDLLVSARAEIGAIHVTKVPVDLRANVAQVIEVLPGNQLERIWVENPTGSVSAAGDPVRIRQIVRNLLTNAIRYGGPQIAIEFGTGIGEVSVAVCDDGPGIPDAERDRIFLPYQIAHTPGSQPSSVGLGLSVSKQLAELMGGRLEYLHRRGRSIFSLHLPQAA